LQAKHESQNKDERRDRWREEKCKLNCRAEMEENPIVIKFSDQLGQRRADLKRLCAPVQ
jgi:hypothetical protein